MKYLKRHPILAIALGIFIGLGLMFSLPHFNHFRISSITHKLSNPGIENRLIPSENEIYEYGMRIDTFAMYENQIHKNEFVSEILANYNVNNQVAHNLAEQSKNVFDFRKFRAGNRYTIFTKEDVNDTVAKYMVYEKNPIEYVIYNLEDPKDIQLFERPTERKERSISGSITGSLWNTLIEAKADPELAVNLSQVYQWTIDFTRIQPGDKFDVVYDEIYVDGEYYQTDSIKACYFQHNGRDFYAFYFDQGEDDLQAGFYDEQGESLKRAFLRAPVKYSRISSRYSGRRFHPVQKRYKAHLGTDYAAAHGTPIYATANGTVIAASYTRGNGNYVKIKHNNTYTTQYLHMSKRAVKNGQHVSQGDVIGYVGSTGLATGPHVCYRFWKNGRQVDHLKLDLPAGDPIKEEHMAKFEVIKQKYMEQLNSSPRTIQPLPEEKLMQHTSLVDFSNQ